MSQILELDQLEDECENSWHAYKSADLSVASLSARSLPLKRIHILRRLPAFSGIFASVELSSIVPEFYVKLKLFCSICTTK
jgi:hypothetical protein